MFNSIPTIGVLREIGGRGERGSRGVELGCVEKGRAAGIALCNPGSSYCGVYGKFNVYLFWYCALGVEYRVGGGSGLPISASAAVDQLEKAAMTQAYIVSTTLMFLDPLTPKRKPSTAETAISGLPKYFKRCVVSHTSNRGTVLLIIKTIIIAQ